MVRPVPFHPDLLRTTTTYLTLRIYTVTLAASALFLLFGVVYLYEALLSIDPEVTDFHPLL